MCYLTPMRFNVLGIWLTSTTLNEAVNSLLRWVASREKRYACVFAVDSILKCQDDPTLAQIANAADAVFTDGMPLVWLGKHTARLDTRRCYGPDIMIHTLEQGCPHTVRHFFYGGADEATMTLLMSRLKERFPSLVIAGHHVPPHRPLTPEEEEHVTQHINACRPDIVWVGIGTPKQDYWLHAFRPRLDAPVLIAVGAAFNFHAGTVAQAPRWMMRHGLEWLFRLYTEPTRLWRRYLIGNPRFVILLIRQWLTATPVRLGQTKGLEARG